MTNFEKIKTMSIDEMAETMCNELTCGTCPLYNECKYTDLAEEYGIIIASGNKEIVYSKCKQKLLKWLESEVEENGDN